MKKVLINVDFIDRYTGKKHIAGKTEDMTEERIAEIKEVNPNFVSVVGNAKTPEKPDEKADEEKADGKKAEKPDEKK